MNVCCVCGHQSSSVLWKKRYRTTALEGAFRCWATSSEIRNINWGQMLVMSLNCYICTVFILVYCLHFIYCGAGACIVLDFWLYVFVHTQTCWHLVEALWNYFNPVHLLSWCCMRLIKYGCTAEGVQIPLWWLKEDTMSTLEMGFLCVIITFIWTNYRQLVWNCKRNCSQMMQHLGFC